MDATSTAGWRTTPTPARAGAGDHGVAVRVEGVEVEVGVRVDEHGGAEFGTRNDECGRSPLHCVPFRVRHSAFRIRPPRSRRRGGLDSRHVARAPPSARPGARRGARGARAHPARPDRAGVGRVHRHGRAGARAEPAARVRRRPVGGRGRPRPAPPRGGRARPPRRGRGGGRGLRVPARGGGGGRAPRGGPARVARPPPGPLRRGRRARGRAGDRDGPGLHGRAGRGRARALDVRVGRYPTFLYPIQGRLWTAAGWGFAVVAFLHLLAYLTIAPLAPRSPRARRSQLLIGAALVWVAGNLVRILWVEVWGPPPGGAGWGGAAFDGLTLAALGGWIAYPAPAPRPGRPRVAARGGGGARGGGRSWCRRRSWPSA